MSIFSALPGYLYDRNKENYKKKKTSTVHQLGYELYDKICLTLRHHVTITTH